MRKLCKINNEWKWIKFSDEEVEDIRKKHRGHCAKIMMECIKDAKAIYESEEESNVSINEIACALFSKRADAVYGWFQNAFDDFIAEVSKRK